MNIEEAGVFRPAQTNELKEMVEELNSDAIETDGFSKIDMRTRLSNVEIPAIVSLDVCISMGAFPLSCSKITRSKKRLAVSLKGKGREEMVDIVRAKEENKKELVSAMDKLRGV